MLKNIYLLLLITIVFFSNSAHSSPQDEVNLYYEESGTGQPIIFIPGWTASHRFFEKQTAYFNKHYQVITLDPRGQGLSAPTLDGNDYLQHGKDLAAFINKRQLKDVILVGWSWGCYDVYGYIREHGTANIKAFVCIDATPKGYGEGSKKYLSSVSVAIQRIGHHRYDFAKMWIQTLIERPLTPDDLNWMLGESLRTPNYVALLLMFDGMNADYSPEAELLDQSGVPALMIVSSSMNDDSKLWLKKNLPNTKMMEIQGKHMMFWEHADEFNQALENFIAQIHSRL